jgi:hypothetical protein
MATRLSATLACCLALLSLSCTQEGNAPVDAKQNSDIIDSIDVASRVPDIGPDYVDTSTPEVDLEQVALDAVTELSETHVGPDADATCVPNCEGKECGADGCGGDCGGCDVLDLCTSVLCTDGICVQKDKYGCCLTNSQCDEGNPCTLDVCLENTCHHPMNPTKPGCCTANFQCKDTNPCTLGACGEDNLCTFQMAPSLPDCCVAHSDCGPGGTADDEKPETLGYCQDNVCQFIDDPTYCVSVSDSQYSCLDDGNPCTKEECVDSVCNHSLFDKCCTKDSHCDDDDPCTAGVCLVDSQECVLEPVEGCCYFNWQCVDGDPCSDDSCIDGQCRHVTTEPNCCETNLDCDDGNPCTLHDCVAGKCELQGIDYAYDAVECCGSNDDCYNADPLCIYECVDNICTAVDFYCEECTEYSAEESCGDKACMCEECLDYKCVHVPPGPWCTNLPDYCCADDDDCNDGNDCTADLCDEDFESETAFECAHKDLTGHPCDDGNPETTDVCIAGECYGVLP